MVRADQSLSIGRMPGFPPSVPTVAGLLGADVLAAYDVELDLPNGRMALYTPRDCAGFVPWPGAVAVPLARTRSGLAFVDAVVDGVTVRALLDTGARTTLLARATAASLGISQAALAHDPQRIGIGIGLGNIDVRTHRFAELGLPGAMQRDVHGQCRRHAPAGRGDAARRRLSGRAAHLDLLQHRPAVPALTARRRLAFPRGLRHSGASFSVDRPARR